MKLGAAGERISTLFSGRFLVIYENAFERFGKEAVFICGELFLSEFCIFYLVSGRVAIYPISKCESSFVKDV